MTPLEAQQLLDNAECVASADTVQAVINRLAGEINVALAADFPLVLAVMGGAVVFAGQLLPQLSFPLEFDYLHVTRYRGNTTGGEMEWRVLPGKNVVGRSALVLDDILDEGQTLAAPSGHAGERLHECSPLLGRGTRVWDGLEGVEKDYRVEATSSPSGVTHVTFTRAGV